MKTLIDYLESEIQYNDKHGKFKSKNLTPVMFYELCDIFGAVNRGYAQDTISKDVADICRKYGFSVQEEGIGWRVMGGDKE
jgi:hypothetical protein